MSKKPKAESVRIPSDHYDYAVPYKMAQSLLSELLQAFDVEVDHKECDRKRIPYTVSHTLMILLDV